MRLLILFGLACAAIVVGLASLADELPLAVRGCSLVLLLPLALLVTLAGHEELYRLSRGRVARRVRAGNCAGCGYDLRHADERCPECGRLKAARKSVVDALGRVEP